MGRLQDRVAIVTGAGSSGPGWGNGKAVAVTFAREGAKIFAIDINEAAAAETTDIIRKEGGTCVPFRADVSKNDDVTALVQAAMRNSAASTFCTTTSASTARAAPHR